MTGRVLRNDFIPVVHRKPRDVYVRLYTLSREGATDVGGAKRATAPLRSREVFSVHTANLHQFSPKKAELTPLLVAERPEPHTTMEGKQSRTDFAGLLSQFPRLEVKVRGVVLAGESPAANCANSSSLHFFTG